MNIGTLTGVVAIEDQLSGHLTTISAHVKRFSDNFDGMTKAVLVGAGVVVGAITGIAASIIALGMKGSTILGVEDAFNRLAVAAGSTGEALFRGLNEGVRGTIDSMELMQSTTRLLSSGMKLTEADMKLMGSTAREMGKATGTDAAQGLNTLSQALLTGNTRSLKRFGINVDLIQSEKDFAKSLGTTRDELSAAGILEAHRIGILEASRVKLDKLGESQLNFKERVQQATVAIGNWFDNLAKGVSSSAKVNEAFTTISFSLAKAFGGDSQTLLQTLLGWVDKFANAVTRVGPIVIQVIGSIRDKVVEIWNAIVDFNNRWQITNNLIAGAKAAWSVLEGAFNLVRQAVQAVIRAWSEMPEWLQRITRTAVEGSIALAAYSVAIYGVATPFRSLIGVVDQWLNVSSNAYITVTAAVGVWPKLINMYKLAHTALGSYLIDLRLTTIASRAEIIATDSVRLAKQTLAAMVNAVTYAYTTMTARIVMSSTYLKAHAAMVYLVTTAKGLWAIAVGFVSTAYTGLITRLGLTTIAMRASSAATLVTKIAMEGLGFAILGIQAIPLIALLGGLAAGLYKVKGAWDGWIKARGEGQNFWIFLHESRDYDNWARQALKYIGILDDVTAAEEKRKRLKGGAYQGSNTSLQMMNDQALAAGSAEMIAAAAKRKKLEDERQGIFGYTEADLVDTGFIKKGTEADDFAKKVRDLGKSYREAASDQDVFTSAFNNLTPAMRANADVQAMLVPEINKLIAAHKQLAPGMMEVLENETRLRIERNTAAASVLSLAGVTKRVIDARIAEGSTLEEIARAYSNNSKNIRVTVDDINALIAVKERLAVVEQAALAKAKKDSERGKEGFNLLTSLREINAEAAKAMDETSNETAVRHIQEQNKKILDSHAATGAARVKIEAEVAKKEAMEIDAVFVDRKAVEETSIKFLQERVKVAEATYLAVTKISGSHSDAVIGDRKKELEIAQDSLRDQRVDWTALRTSSTSNLRSIADAAKATYLEASKAGSDQSKAQIANYKRIWEAAVEAAKGSAYAWKNAAVDIADAFANVFSALTEGIESKTVQAVAKAAHIFSSGLKVMVDSAKTAGERISAGLATAAGMISALFGNSMGGAIAAGALGGAAAGVSIGFMLGGPVGAGYGAAIGAIAGAITGWFSAAKKAREATAAANKQLNEYREGLLDTYGSLQNVEAAATAMGTALGDVWMNQGVKGLEAFQKELDSFNTRMETLQKALEKYGLTWKDLGQDMRQVNVNAAASSMLGDFKALQSGGVPVEKAIKAMSGAFSQLIIDAVQTGTKIPAALQPVLRQMIELGYITDNAAKAMLGLADSTMPSLADITAAAERYGITLDELGPKVKQLEITELANQYVADWDILTAATDDWGVLFDKMGPKVQDLITDAMRYGSELPSKMKPMIQAFIDAGRLVDENGEALTDLSGLTFAADLTEMFEGLMTKLDELIDKITNGVGDAFDKLGRKVVSPTIAPRYQSPTSPEGPSSPEPSSSPEDPAYMASGGVVQGNVVAFRPRGTDTVPAMLTPGERVLSVSEARRQEEATGGTAIIEIEGRRMMEVLVPHMRKVTKRYGLSRR